jgi:LacI family transcriptional regulator
VINNSPDVADATRELVLRAITELDYHPNAQAVGLSRNRSDIVGVVVDTVTEPFFAHILDAVLRALRSRGRLALLATVDSTSQLDAIDALQNNRRIDGLVIILPLASSLEWVRRTVYRVPTVHVDLQYDLDVHGISVNNCQGAYIATEHLISLGHHRIGIITGRRDIPVGPMRLAGYRAALESHGLPFDESLVAAGDFSFDSGRRCTEQLLALENPPTAIFACDDQMAFGVINTLRGRGLRVPDDISVIGFDDTVDAARYSPPLTTIRQPLHKMGELAGEYVCRLIDGLPVGQRRITLDTELVVRETTGPARRAEDYEPETGPSLQVGSSLRA